MLGTSEELKEYIGRMAVRAALYARISQYLSGQALNVQQQLKAGLKDAEHNG